MPDAFDRYEASNAGKTGVGSTPTGGGDAFDRAEQPERLDFAGNLGQVVKHTISGLNPIPLINLAGAIVTSPLPNQLGAGSRQILKQTFYDPSVAQYEKANQEYQQGNKSNALLRAFLAPVPAIGPAMLQAADEYDQTGNWGAPVGDLLSGEIMARVPGAAASKASSTARAAYEKALNFRQGVKLNQRPLIVEQGLQRRLPVEKESIPILEDRGIKNEVNRLTKDPNSPFSQKPISIAKALEGITEWIDNVAAKADPFVAKKARAMRDHWAEQLGYKAPTAAVPAPNAGQLPGSTFAPGTVSGTNPGRIVPSGTPASPGNTMTTVAKVQELKEAINNMTPSGAHRAVDKSSDVGSMQQINKSGAGGMKRAIEEQVGPVRALNREVNMDLQLRDAISSAIRRKPDWLKSYTSFIASVGLSEMFNTGGKTGKNLVTGALTRAAMAHPGVMSRLALALDSVGVHLPSEFLGATGRPAAAINAVQERNMLNR
ncbi:MAG TPA: hypothetical protein VF077_09415 [Nitrospiraceae bacterium]